MKAGAAALAAVLAAGCAAGPRVRVDADGWAPLGPAGERAAREAALSDARRRAVEEGSGVRVVARSIVRNGESAGQRVSTSASGALARWSVLSEERKEGGILVRIRAEVELRTPRPWPAGTSAFVEEGPRAADAALAWSAAGGVLSESRESADVVLRAAVAASVVEEPRARPFVSRRAKATLRLSRADGEAWTSMGESAALGLDAIEAEERAAGEALAAAVAAARP